MNGYSKEHAGHDTGKSHSTKCERELLYRICPSKLSRKELEDLYFALLENNLELKKTLNSQQDNIKLLSTKVQRMTATQRSSLIKESKDCCAATKAVVQEQKACIADLKKSNERMSERIRILNMRLCTAKQFLKRSPSQTMSRCFKCLTAAPASMKNSSVSVLHSRRSENNPKTSVATSQYTDNKEVTTKDVETETCELETGSSDKMCNENKCKTLMEEFKQKIINLQEELSHTHEEYSSRISSLEREVNRAEQQRSLQEEQNGTRVRELAAKLRDQEANYNDISTQLSIEKSKVTELEMRLKAADSSAQIAKTIDTHLSNINELRRQSSKPDNKFETSSPLQLPNWEVPSLHLEVPELQPVINRVSPGPEPEPDREDTRLSKHSDDSGYTDVNRTQDYDQDNKALAKINKELMERISSLQEQLDAIKISTNDETEKHSLHNKSFQSEDIDTEDYKDVGVDDVSDGPSQEFTKIIVEKQRNKSNTEQSPDRNESLQERRSMERSADMCRVNELWNSYDDTPNTENTIQATSTHPIQLEQLEQSVEKKKEPVPSARQKPIKIATNTKSDTHNSFQIPGPLPVHNTENIAGSKEKPWPRTKRKLIDIRTRKDTNYSKDNLNANNAGKYEEPTLQTEDETTQFYQNRNATVDKQPALDGSEQNLKLGSTKIETLDQATISDDKRDATINKMQANNAGVQAALMDVNQLGTQMDNGQHIHHKQQPQADRQRRPSHRPLSGDRTYSIAGDNTDCEISSLTDLPDEGDADVASYREPLSPGEHKATTTECTDHTMTTTDYGSLSEGELPAPVRKRSKELRATAETKLIQPVSVTQKVEEALQAIGEELARCRELLHTQKPLGPQKTASVDVSTSVERCPSQIPLRRAVADSCIGEASTPNCIFTVHFGTMVLSDEAVVSSRNMSLIVSWKFYDHDVAMTRVRSGRVVLFDFSTEYDVKIHDDFLNYLKYGEMSIEICELNKQDEPFATCALPLRDALLHTNKRADMSLAIVAGPGLLRGSRAEEQLVAGDEVGVLDLWCLLRAPPHALQAINRAIARPSPLMSSSKSSFFNQLGTSTAGIMKQVVEDEQSNEERLSQDLDIHMGKKPKETHVGIERMSIGQLITSKEAVTSRTQNGDYPSPALADLNPHIEKKQWNQLPSTNQWRNQSSSMSHKLSFKNLLMRRRGQKSQRVSIRKTHSNDKHNDFSQALLKKEVAKRYSKSSHKSVPVSQLPAIQIEEPPELGTRKVSETTKKSVTILPEYSEFGLAIPEKDSDTLRSEDGRGQGIDITVLWLVLNEECEAMTNKNVQCLYVAYSFLGRSGADLETPVSLPKPKNYVDKCVFNFRKSFQLSDCDLPLLGHMARCRSGNRRRHDPRDCIVFAVISEPPEDPLGLDSCEDIGYAYLYLGDMVSSSGCSDSYTEVVPVRSARDRSAVCGVLALRLDGLHLVRKCLLLSNSRRDFSNSLRSL